MCAADNPWLTEVEANLPRLLALFDTDPCSPTRGQGDRLFWAWKLKDFGNATFQGAAHGLARLLAAGLLPSWLPEDAVLVRIDAMFAGARRLTRANGSLEEAFPYESSFCVTALVAWDLLSACSLLVDRLSAQRRAEWLDVARPWVRFLRRADETHGVISNHLATAAVALLRWHDLTGEEADGRAREFLDRILRHRSDEGWFLEYQGADPGYQTLAIAYLAEAAKMRPGWGLQAGLADACRFLSYFVHPDGSFAGHYGSRETRIFYPGGIELLATEVPAAAALALAIGDAIPRRASVPLAAIDESNLIPLFNSYCRAAELRAAGTTPAVAESLPCRSPGPWRRRFPEAGLLVDRRPGSYTVVSWHKGGVAMHCPDDGPAQWVSAPLTARGAALYSAQTLSPANRLQEDEDSVVIDAELRRVRHQLPDPLRFMLLRLLNLTMMRISSAFGAWIKQALAWLLITRKGRAAGRVSRRIVLAPRFAVEDRVDSNLPLAILPSRPPHSTLHMASRGYWQRGDEAP